MNYANHSIFSEPLSEMTAANEILKPYSFDHLEELHKKEHDSRTSAVRSSNKHYPNQARSDKIQKTNN